jgi:hypothetical protein
VSPLPLDGLIGAPPDEVARRLGRPSADRAAGGGRWLRFEGEGWSLRVRLGVDGRVASWTLSVPGGAVSLREVAEPVGLWPDCAPDATAATAGRPLLRRRLHDPEGGPDRSLTASIRGGRIVALTAFDEPPDW